MPDKRPDEITTYAKDAFIKYGDGYAAQIVSMKPAKDNDNNDVWDIVIRPSDELIKAYDIRSDREDGVVLVRQELPFEFVVHLNPDPSWNWWFYLKTYKGEITPAIRKLFKIELLEEIAELKKEKEILRQGKEVAEEIARLMEANLPTYIKRNIIPILDQVVPLAEKLMPNKTKND